METGDAGGEILRVRFAGLPNSSTSSSASDKCGGSGSRFLGALLCVWAFGCGGGGAGVGAGGGAGACTCAVTTGGGTGIGACFVFGVGLTVGLADGLADGLVDGLVDGLADGRADDGRGTAGAFPLDFAGGLSARGG